MLNNFANAKPATGAPIALCATGPWFETVEEYA